jgi:hypothetical protein
MTSSACRDGIEFSCDTCDEVWTPPRLGRGSEPRDWNESWNAAKAAGWRAIKNKRGEWEHACPECRSGRS